MLGTQMSGTKDVGRNTQCQAQMLGTPHPTSLSYCIKNVAYLILLLFYSWLHVPKCPDFIEIAAAVGIVS